MSAATSLVNNSKRETFSTQVNHDSAVKISSPWFGLVPVLSRTIRNLDPGNAKFAKSWFTGENPH